MLTYVQIDNFRSFVNAKINLSPFTLLIGANGSGKTNFLKFLEFISKLEFSAIDSQHHHNQKDNSGLFVIDNSDAKRFAITHEQHPFINKSTRIIESEKGTIGVRNQQEIPMPDLRNVQIYQFNPSAIGSEEQTTGNPTINGIGRGVADVLDYYNGLDRNKFDHIESIFKNYVPEVETVRLKPGVNPGHKIIQVQEKNISKPVQLKDLSEGSRFIMALICTIFQPKPPSLICIEDIDRGLHPRLLEQIVRMCLDVAKDDTIPQIIATTHNPYLVDQMAGYEEAVIIVDKENGVSKLTKLADLLDEDEKSGNTRSGEENYESALGSLWFSGFYGGVPKRSVRKGQRKGGRGKKEGVQKK